jgi:AraC family transcriptional regulator of adaptative response/methylated-DNA-[protein]-cysteine methyltransferase
MQRTSDSSKPAIRTVDDRRWAAVLARDSGCDGKFFTCVHTTGVFCRPSCPARHPKRENVTFHDTARDAQAAGFRPCKRCKPLQLGQSAARHAMVAAACRVIESSDEEPSLAALAAASGLSPHHFHRIFKLIAGITPKAYAMAHRQQRVRQELTMNATVTAAIHDSGYNSGGRFYAGSNDILGMTPSAYRAGGKDTEIRFAVARCSLGAILVAASPKGVCSILFGDDPNALLRDLQKRFPKAHVIAGDGDFEAVVAKVIAFVEAPATGLDLPLDIRGTAFQHRVWQALRAIPAGQTATYADIACRIGAPNAVRAVGTACGANPIAVAVPCHRVVRADGSFPDANYRWGSARKRALLAKEARKTPR